MGINPIQQLKNKPGSLPSKLLSQGESPDNLLGQQDLEIENKEELTKENYDPCLPPFGIKLDQKLQNAIATLEVESPNSEQDLIIIRCRHGLLKIGEQFDSEPITAPKISFVKMIEEIREIIGTMRMFSQENSQAKRLRGWLLNLQKELETIYQQELSYLIINDRTKFEIPWEMLELEPKKNNYLGASIVTVRWQDITNPHDLDNVNSLINLEIEEKNCCGNMVAYLNIKDLPSVAEEKKIIQAEFNPIIHENIYSFFDFLDSVNLPISLIFIASHGFLGNDLSQSKLGEDNSKQQISLPQLYEYDFDFLGNSPSIVFMNTCHSGRLQQDNILNIIDPNPQTGQNYPTGFSTFFLKKGAKGVIGTLCKVADKYAAMVSHNFFTEYKENPDLSAATILRNLRLKAAEKFQSQKNDENRYLFIFTFMYIYYGNPMTKLQLIAREDS